MNLLEVEVCLCQSYTALPGPCPCMQVADPSGGNTSGRAGFNMQAWAQQQGLGTPVAVTYFLSQR